MNPLPLTDPIPEGPKDRMVASEVRMREWLNLLQQDQRFTYTQAAHKIGVKWNRSRVLLNKLQKEGIVEYMGHERARTWRRC